MTRKEVRVEVWRTWGNYPDGEQSPPTNLQAFSVWLAGKTSLIPVEYMSTARIEFEGEYDTGCVNIEISYRRLETDEEMQRRLAWEERCRREKEADDRAILARLKAQYERGRTDI